jgi:hypothetical protein
MPSNGRPLEEEEEEEEENVFTIHHFTGSIKHSVNHCPLSSLIIIQVRHSAIFTFEILAHFKLK